MTNKSLRAELSVSTEELDELNCIVNLLLRRIVHQYHPALVHTANCINPWHAIKAADRRVGAFPKVVNLTMRRHPIVEIIHCSLG